MGRRSSPRAGASSNDAQLRPSSPTSPELFPKFRPFLAYVSERERLPGRGSRSMRPPLSSAFIEKYSMFSCSPEEADDDAPL